MTTSWNNNAIQFPRLLAEMYATMDFTGDQLDALCETMDLERADIMDLMARADVQWQEIKDRTALGMPEWLHWIDDNQIGEVYCTRVSPEPGAYAIRHDVDDSQIDVVIMDESGEWCYDKTIVDWHDRMDDLPFELKKMAYQEAATYIGKLIGIE